MILNGLVRFKVLKALVELLEELGGMVGAAVVGVLEVLLGAAALEGLEDVLEEALDEMVDEMLGELEGVVGAAAVLE